MNKIKIMLVDDQMLIREGLKTIINLQDDMEVVAEAENGKVAVDQIKAAISGIDVILMDIRMPILNGVEATSTIKRDYPDTAIIILTTFDDDDYIIEALSNGAIGYLLKDIDSLHLIQSIRDANKGQMMLPGIIAMKLAARISDQKTNNNESNQGNSGSLLSSTILTSREKEIGSLIAQGLSNRQIAQKLFLSEGTVKNYISEIYAKLGTSNRTKAAISLKSICD